MVQLSWTLDHEMQRRMETGELGLTQGGLTLTWPQNQREMPQPGNGVSDEEPR